MTHAPRVWNESSRYRRGRAGHREAWVMDAATEKAIQNFPIEGWLAKFTQVYPTDHGKAFYADCPICGTRRKLGVYHASRIAVCGRCKDGGHGRGIWDGVASL